MTIVGKRSVQTDALQTLGTIIGEGEKRDAIHLAVEPAVAGQLLGPGQHVGRNRDGAWVMVMGNGIKPLGIVDPFLRRQVRKGERFWLVVYPRQITSLRHVWSHPDFPEADQITSIMTVKEDHPESRKWIQEFAGRIQMGEQGDSEDGNALMLTYEELMESAARWIQKNEMTCLRANIDYDDDMHASIPEFWRHYAIVTGQDIPEERRDYFFRCVC